MQSKNKCLKVGFLVISLAVTVILFCATPCSAYTDTLTVEVSDTVNLGTDYAPDYIGVGSGWAEVYGTLNMYPGAYVDWGISSSKPTRREMVHIASSMTVLFWAKRCFLRRLGEVGERHTYRRSYPSVATPDSVIAPWSTHAKLSDK